MRTTSMLAVLLVLQLGPSAARAQTPPAPDRWAAWLGCWSATAGSTGSRLCIVPATGGGTAWITLVGAQRLGEEIYRPGAPPQPLADPSCRGTESARWSTEGLRLYHSATASCGAAEPRRLSGVAYLADGPTLVHVEAVGGGESANVRVRVFSRARAQDLPDGTRAPRPSADTEARGISRPWTVADVIEASTLLPPDAVQAAITEGPAAFSLTKASLTSLAQAKVAERVIDLMVATTFPSRFTLSSNGPSMSVSAGGGGVDPFYAPIIGPASLYGCYGPYGWATASYWSMCDPYSGSIYSTRYGYGGLPYGYTGYYGDPWYYGYWYVPGNSTIGTGTGETPAAAPVGRVVNGRGYTQIHPVDTTPSAAFSNGGGGTNSTSSSGGGNSGGGASPSGYSGGGGGGGDRTAVPRPPGH